MLTGEGRVIRDIKERKRKLDEEGEFYLFHNHAPSDIDFLLKDRGRLCRKANDLLDENLLLKATVGYARRERYDHRTDPNL